MKSKLVKELKESGVRRINGERIKRMNMYELVHYVKLLRNSIEKK